MDKRLKEQKKKFLHLLVAITPLINQHKKKDFSELVAAADL